MADSQNDKSKDRKIPSDDEPITFDWNDNSGTEEISHSPLNIGREVNIADTSDNKTISSDRITAMKTFYTKLFPGSISSIDEQITLWLKDNPDVRIKYTNVVTGTIIDKSTEPHLIVTVWY